MTKLYDRITIQCQTSSQVCVVYCSPWPSPFIDIRGEGLRSETIFMYKIKGIAINSVYTQNSKQRNVVTARQTRGLYSAFQHPHGSYTAVIRKQWENYLQN